MTTIRRHLGPTSLKVEYLAGDDGVTDVGDGIAVQAHDDGGMQFAIYWSDAKGRHTVLLEAVDPTLFAALGTVISDASKVAEAKRESTSIITFVRRAGDVH